MYFLGLDVGTQGVRAVISDEVGELIAKSSRPIASDSKKKLPERWAEQAPLSWWEGVSLCLKEVIASLREKGISSQEIKAISVTSTSGTVLSLGEGDEPLRKAIMYNDSRAVEEARLVNEAGKNLVAKLGYQFKPSFALSKILWLKRHEPKIYNRTKRFIHAGDFIVGKLTGDYSTTDTSNALKTGYDLVDKRWPRFISRDLEIPHRLFPEVVTPGTPIGSISPACAIETGLSRKTAVTAGTTDGTASLISTGVASPGEWVSTVGTTLVVKGISEKLVKDKEGRVYCHLHPDGFWLPGGASSVGGECLKDRFADENLTELDRHVMDKVPTHLIIYPLVRTGERFPFVNPEAEGFIIGRARDKYELYGAYLEGVGLVERWIYELLEELGAEVGERIWTAGGGAKSREWLQIRANILNKTLIRPKIVESAFGAAIVAASRTVYPNLIEATRKMVRVDLEVAPEAQALRPYEVKYRKFRDACRAIGYG